MKIISNKQKAIQELKRISERTENNNKVNVIVEEILNAVKEEGDEAVERYTRKFDGYNPIPMRVKSEELKDAWEKTENVTDVVNIGDVLDVKYFGVDPRTRKDKVSRKALLPKPEGYVDKPRKSFNRNNKRNGYNKK